MKLLKLLAQLLFPSKCILCGKVLGEDELDLCRTCRVDAPEYPQGKLKLQFIDSFAAVWYYDNDVRKSLIRYKFYRARHYALGYGRLLAMKVAEKNPDGFDLITWVPISFLRKLKRGYDQDEVLARAVASELGMEHVGLLKKIRHTKPQSRIKGAEKRRANVLGAYRCLDEEAVKGKRILLIDDILTTGATASECARILLTAGAEEVHCATVAVARKHK